MRPRILLTGRYGQVGWELERILPKVGEAFAFGRNEMDLANPEQIREKIRLIKPDVIVNAAAYTAVDKAEEEPGPAMAVNGIAPGILAEEAKNLGALLVHYSTDYVFDGTKAEPYTEEDEPNPLNVYGKTKLAGEKAIQATWEKHLILRTSWVYGMRGKNFLLTILKLAKEKDEIRVVDDQVGAPTWCRMIAEGTALILSRNFKPDDPARKQITGLFHLTASGCTSWFGFAKAILEQENNSISRRVNLVPIPSSGYPTHAKRPMNSRMCCRSLSETLGITFESWHTCLTKAMMGNDGNF